MYGASKLKWLAKRRDGSTLFMISSYTVPWHRGQRSCTSGVRINLMTRFFRCSHIFGARNQRLAEKKPRGQRFVNLGHIRWVDRFQPPSFPRLVFFAAILLLSKLSCWSLLRRPISSSLHRQKTDTLRRVSFFAPPICSTWERNHCTLDAEPSSGERRHQQNWLQFGDVSPSVVTSDRNDSPVFWGSSPHIVRSHPFGGGGSSERFGLIDSQPHDVMCELGMSPVLLSWNSWTGVDCIVEQPALLTLFFLGLTIVASFSNFFLGLTIVASFSNFYIV